MKKYYLVILLLLFVPFVSAVNLTTGLESYWSFDNANISGSTVYDLTANSNDGTNQGSTTGVTGVLNEGFSLTTNDYVDMTSTSNLNVGTGAFSVGAWVYFDDTTTNSAVIGRARYNSGWTGYHIQREASADKFRFQLDGSNVAIGSTTVNSGQWYFVVGTRSSAGVLKIYVNGADDTGTGGSSSANVDIAYPFYVGRLTHTDPFYLNGDVDEAFLYKRELNSSEISEIFNSGPPPLSYYDFVNVTPPTPPTPVKVESLEQTTFLEQTSTTSVNGLTYSPILSGSVNLANNVTLYGSASIPLLPSASNEATCRLTIDGAEMSGTESIRTLVSGVAGNMLITSDEVNVSAGLHDFGVECRRSSVPSGSFDVYNTTFYVHILTTTDGRPLVTTHMTADGVSASGLINSTTITTSENYTDTGLIRALVMEWVGTYSYGATGNISMTTEVAGVNCTPVIRYGTIGSFGSVAGACYVPLGNETNSTTYDIKVFGTGSGTLLNADFHTKEFVIHENEINSSVLSGINLSGSGVTLSSINISVAVGHTTPNLVTETVVSVLSTSGTQDSSFYISNSTENSSVVRRTVNLNQAGVIGIQQDFSSVTGNVIISLVGSCASCSLTGVELLAYLSDDEPITPNVFEVTAKSVYDDSAFSDFSINLSDGRSFTTTTGLMTIFIEDEIVNVSFLEDSGASIPYFANETINFNTTFDLDQYLTPYTAVYGLWNGSLINNFSVSYINLENTSDSANYSTTSGVVYVPFYNSSYNLSIFDAYGSSGEELANLEASVSVSSYLENYTFTMLYPNSFNFTLKDEITEELITANMTIEVISSASAGVYTTTNGTLLLELLTPSDYTIRYKSTLDNNYTERDYIQVLVNRDRYDLELFSILDTESTDMVVTIKDTGGDYIENAQVSLLRYYTSCNCYKVVEMGETSASGEAYFVADAYDGHYKFSVSYEGISRFVSTSPENFIPSVTGLITRTITINLGSAYFESWRELTDIGRTISYNETTKGLSFTWNDPSGIVTRGCLYASYLDGVHYTDVTPTCQNASTGSVVLVLNDTSKGYKYYAEIETSTTYSDYTLFSGYIDKLKDALLDDIQVGAFLGGMLVVILALMFSFSAIAVMIITAIGVIGITALGLVTLPMAFVTGLVTLIIGFTAYFMRS